MSKIVTPDNVVEQECMKEVNQVLQKYGCTLIPQVVLGNVPGQPMLTMGLICARGNQGPAVSVSGAPGGSNG